MRTSEEWPLNVNVVESTSVLMIEVTVQYQTRYGVRLLDRLGDGKDGSVFGTGRRRAVKFFRDGSLYRRELQAYQILHQRDIHELIGFQIPELIRNDDELLAIEMTIVQPPFLLDFASAHTLDEYAHLGFSQEVLDEREAHWAEVFEENWPVVREVCDAFASATGLILLDLSPNNIKFAAARS